MEAHGLNLKGKLFIEEVEILPTWTSADKRRVLYCSADSSYYAGTGIGWNKLQTGSGIYSSPTIDPTLVLNPTFGTDYLLSCSRASGGSIINKNQVQEVIGNNITRIDWKGGKPGFLIEEQRTNYLLNSGTPVTQNVSLAANTYTLSVVGSGSCTLSGGPSGTATEGSDITFTLASTTTVTFTVSGTLIRFQCEDCPHSTSYIPTTSAAATRLADRVEIPISSFWNTNEGTIYCEFIGPKFGKPTGTYDTFLLIDNGFATNFFIIFSANAGTSSTLYFSKTVATINTIIKNLGANIPGSIFKIAFSYSSTMQKACINGGSVSGVSDDLPIGLTTLRLGPTGLTNQPNTKINRIFYYPKFMTDIELQELTKD